MGDLTESSTKPYIRRHSVALSTTVNSFILNPLMGNIGSMTTLPRDGGDSKRCLLENAPTGAKRPDLRKTENGPNHVFQSRHIPRDRRAELEAAVVAAGR